MPFKINAALKFTSVLLVLWQFVACSNCEDISIDITFKKLCANALAHLPKIGGSVEFTRQMLQEVFENFMQNISAAVHAAYYQFSFAHIR